MKKTAIGAVAPDFTSADTSGKVVSLHDFMGKYVLNVFMGNLVHCIPNAKPIRFKSL
jgi:peroxiredoxin